MQYAVAMKEDRAVEVDCAGVDGGEDNTRDNLCKGEPGGVIGAADGAVDDVGSDGDRGRGESDVKGVCICCGAHPSMIPRAGTYRFSDATFTAYGAHWVCSFDILYWLRTSVRCHLQQFGYGASGVRPPGRCSISESLSSSIGKVDSDARVVMATVVDPL